MPSYVVFLDSETSLFDFSTVLDDFSLFTNDLKRQISLPMSPLSSLEAGTNFLVVRLNIEPNPMAITVQTKQMTLYGMLKSGVGKEIKSSSV